MFDEEDLYKRHNGIEMKVPNEIFVIGCGGTGTWTSIMAALMGVKIIHIADHDIIEIHNLSRLPYRQSDIGRLKTDVLKEYLQTIRPDSTIYTYDGIHTDLDLIALTGDVIFDCNDNPKVQKMIFDYCKEHKLRYIGVGCNANHISVIENLDLVCRSDEHDPYEITPIFLLPALVASACGLWNVIKGKQNIYTLKNISDILEK